MNWRLVRAAALTIAPLALLAALVETRLWNGGITPAEIRLFVCAAMIYGAWSPQMWAYFAAEPAPEPSAAQEAKQDDDDRDPLAAALRRLAGAEAAIPIMQIGSDGPCEGCGEIHNEPMVLVPLPDGTLLVSHKYRQADAGECSWAVHVDDSMQARAAAQVHEEFECGRRHARR